MSSWDELLESLQDFQKTVSAQGERLVIAAEELSQIALEKVSLGYSLPLPHVLQHKTEPLLPPPMPPTVTEKLVARIRGRPFLATAVIGLVLPCASYACYQSYLYFRYSQLPFRLAQTTIKRPLTSGEDSSRLEAVLILGCDQGSLAHQLALDLAGRGFVVFATVSDEDELRALEISGKGYVKALLLDPQDVSLI